MATFAGQNVGAKKIERITQGLKSVSLVGCIYCVLAFLVIFFFGKDMVSLFVDADDPSIIAEVLDKAQQFLTVNSAVYIPLLFVNIMRFAIQGVGFTSVAMTAGVMELIGRAGVAILLVPLFGYSAAVWANPVAWILADAFLFPCYFTVMKWLRNRLLLTGQATQSPKEYAANSKSVN
jgi:Na+-driven multidrug efflux pump